MYNRKLIDAIQRCRILIDKVRDDCAVPTDRFYGDTAEALISVRQSELDRIMVTYELLNRLLKEDY